MKQSDQVPVFLHVPKNAGTYVIDVMHKHVDRLTGNDMDFHAPVKKLTIETESFGWSLIVKFLTNNHESDVNIRPHAISIKRGVNNPWVKSCELSTLQYYLSKNYIQIWSIIVEPVSTFGLRTGLFQANNMIAQLQKQPINYTCLREPFDRQQSLFNYLTSSASGHEPTHEKLKCKTFDEYLNSNYLEDSWFIRNLTGAPDSIELNQYWYNNTLSIIDEFKINIFNSANPIHMLNQITAKCWHTNILSSDTARAHGNKQAYNRILFENMSTSTQENFQSRMKWEIKLYNEFINENKKQYQN